jgi:signal transduction histidine kinase
MARDSRPDGKHLLGLINDVLDISKIEAGQLSLSFDEYSLQGLVEAVITSTGVLAQAKGIELKAVISPDLPVGYGDERRLTQVLLNIVGNAIKFTDTGSAHGGRIDLRLTPGVGSTFTIFLPIRAADRRQAA